MIGMRGSILKGRNRALVSFSGRTGLSTKANFKIITYMAKASIYGWTTSCMTGNGQIIKCMGSENSLYPMGNIMKDITRMIRRRGMGSSTGLMERSLRVNGNKGSRMERGY